MLISRRTAVLSGLALPALSSRVFSQSGPVKIRLGQPTTSLSYAKIFAARALDTFPAEGVAFEWVSIPGGDPAVLAAVDSGNLELAAVGSDTALAAIAKGQPFKIIYSLMSKLPYDLTVSKTYLAKSGIAIDAPLKTRLGVMKDAVIGVSALGGAQDRVARWMAVQGDLDPKALKLAVVGSPPALGAALENGRIDAFVLSPPESTLAVEKDYGAVLVRPSKEIPGASVIPSLVLVAKADPTPTIRAGLISTMRAMNKAAEATRADPDAVADKIREKFFPKLAPGIIRSSINAMADGLGGDGRLTDEAIAGMLKFSAETASAAPQGTDFFTNDYVDAALKKA